MEYTYLTTEEQNTIKAEYIKGIEESHLRDSLYVKEIDGKIAVESADEEKTTYYQRIKDETLQKIAQQEESIISLTKESVTEIQK